MFAWFAECPKQTVEQRAISERKSVVNDYSRLFDMNEKTGLGTSPSAGKRDRFFLV